MSAPVFAVPSLDGVGAGSLVEVSGPEGRHAATVRRITAGESVALTDGAGGLATGVVESASRDSLTVVVSDRADTPAPEPRLVVVQALPKGDRGELAVEGMTEVGVDVVVPWAASRCVTQWRGERGEKALRRWRCTAYEASKQARRSRFLQVAPLASTAEVGSLLGDAALGVVLHEEAVSPVAAVGLPPAGSVVVVVGPEGGITPDELTAFAAAGASAYRLGPTVLRTSTAGVAAASVLLAASGRWA